jgi:hypothetical protein
MGARVTAEEDYIEKLTEEIERERAAHPGESIPWSWWKERAEAYGVTPNNIYSRAISRGVYIPPSGRTRSRTRTAARSVTSGAKSSVERDAPSSSHTPETSPKTPSASGILASSLKEMAQMAELLSEMEGRVTEMEREKEREAARRREALRALDRLARVMEEVSGTLDAVRRLYEE